jgi:hypothetical protein
VDVNLDMCSNTPLSLRTGGRESWICFCFFYYVVVYQLLIKKIFRTSSLTWHKLIFFQKLIEQYLQFHSIIWQNEDLQKRLFQCSHCELSIYMLTRKILTNGSLWLNWSHLFKRFTVAIMTWLTVAGYLFHKWARICMFHFWEKNLYKCCVTCFLIPMYVLLL